MHFQILATTCYAQKANNRHNQRKPSNSHPKSVAKPVIQTRPPQTTTPAPIQDDPLSSPSFVPPTIAPNNQNTKKQNKKHPQKQQNAKKKTPKHRRGKRYLFSETIVTQENATVSYLNNTKSNESDSASNQTRQKRGVPEDSALKSKAVLSNSARAGPSKKKVASRPASGHSGSKNGKKGQGSRKNGGRGSGGGGSSWNGRNEGNEGGENGEEGQD